MSSTYRIKCSWIMSRKELSKQFETEMLRWQRICGKWFNNIQISFQHAVIGQQDFPEVEIFKHFYCMCIFQSINPVTVQASQHSTQSVETLYNTTWCYMTRQRNMLQFRLSSICKLLFKQEALWINPTSLALIHVECLLYWSLTQTCITFLIFCFD